MENALKHRPKLSDQLHFFNSCVARPVGKKEQENVPAARGACTMEWSKLMEKGVWEMMSVREWEDVAKEAKLVKDYDTSWLVVHDLCRERSLSCLRAILPENIKGRVVFLGDQVTDQNWEAAIFQDLGSAPATMEGARVCDMYGTWPGHAIEQADAEQAYIQAALKGPTTWIEIPRMFWPESWKGYRRPVVILKKALYGHPNSGSFWEERCDTLVQQCGFKLMEGWPSAYWHPLLELMLIVYVDDFKFWQDLKETWLRAGNCCARKLSWGTQEGRACTWDVSKSLEN